VSAECRMRPFSTVLDTDRMPESVELRRESNHSAVLGKLLDKIIFTMADVERLSNSMELSGRKLCKFIR
jgi:hypothetical protein